MATKRPRSACWDHFKKEGESTACLIGQCKAKVKHSGNTSNLLKHLHSCHLEEYKKCIAEKQQTRKKTKTSEDTSKQITLLDTMSLSQKYPQDSTRCKRLNSALIEMDLQPISIVEDKGFLRYTSLFDQRYVPPSRRTITGGCYLKNTRKSSQT